MRKLILKFGDGRLRISVTNFQGPTNNTFAKQITKKHVIPIDFWSECEAGGGLEAPRAAHRVLRDALPVSIYCERGHRRGERGGESQTHSVASNVLNINGILPRTINWTCLQYGQHPELRSWISWKFVDRCRALLFEVHFFEKTSSELFRSQNTLKMNVTRSHDGFFAFDQSKKFVFKKKLEIFEHEANGFGQKL